jgi:branched-subunit amino acid ABC-type transport system permease component
MTGSLFGQLFIDGMATGLVFVILACGFIIIMSVSRIMFLAYGSFYTIGAYTTWYSMTFLHVHYALGLAIGVASASLVGLIAYTLIFRRLKLKYGKRAFMSTLIGGIGLQMLLNQTGVLLYGNQSRSIPNVFPGNIYFLNMHITVARVVLMSLSVSIALVLFYFYRRTAIGRSMRAVSIRPDLSAVQGINVNRIYLLALGLGCALAGSGGAMLAPVYGMDTAMGANIVWVVMLGTMLGGMSNLMGAVVGALIIGQVLSFGLFFMGSLIQLVVYVGIMIMMYFRPGGILGRVLDLGIASGD